MRNMSNLKDSSASGSESAATAAVAAGSLVEDPIDVVIDKLLR